MTLPTSGPLSLDDIGDELGVNPTFRSLGGMSDTASFLAPDAISDFYGFSNLTEYSGSALQGATKFICTATRDVTYYHNGSGAFPALGDDVFTDTTGTTLGAGYHRSNTFAYTETDSSGEVIATFLCIS